MLANRSMPAAAVIPVVGYENVGEAVAWLSDVFGFTERWRAGTHRAQLAIGDAAVAVTKRAPHECHATVMVRVDDVDAHYAHARDRGAVVAGPPTDHAYGERQYSATDLGGHTWTFSQSIADVPPEDWGGTSGPGLT